jgi:hypothetical protein
MTKYRENMTPEETKRLLDECAKLDEAYSAPTPQNAELGADEAEAAEAAYEQSYDYFNRYVAGDR